MRKELSDQQIKADIMNKLFRRHCWGAKYFPFTTLINWMSKQIKKNGKRVQRLIEQLVKDDYVITHKRGRTISLNPTRNREILEYIKRILPT